ncbi:RAD52 motif-containing protein 1-like [Eschrichtius robustus]|uniref:RAD52 motif-containing protein 1-like n=1 Tax=Eschrichtius robustus TaxID=9764 RepID=UPI0035C091E2
MGTTKVTNGTIRPLPLVRGSVRKQTAPAHGRLRTRASHRVCARAPEHRICARAPAHRACALRLRWRPCGDATPVRRRACAGTVSLRTESRTSGNGRMVPFVTFVVPIVGDKTLRVWELSSGPTAEPLVFSQFGFQCSVRVVPNAAVAGPGFYAIIKVYAARDAHRAQKACDQKQLFQASPVKGRLGTRHKAVRHSTLALNSSRCQELANYYFGFNGWSKRIIRVVLPSHECRSPGVGMAEEPLDKLEEGSLSFLMKRKVTQKLAIQKAMTDAFWKLLIVVLDLSTENTTSENNTAQNVSEEIISTENSTLPGRTGPGNTTHRNVSTAHSTVAADNSMPTVQHTNETQWE